MRSFSPGELAGMQGVQEAAMQDRGQVLAYSQAADAYGNPHATYTAQAETACGVRLVRPREVQASGQVPLIDIELRLPLDTVISTLDRFRVTKRFGVSQTAQDYEIIGPVLSGPSGLVISLRKVTGG